MRLTTITFIMNRTACIMLPCLTLALAQCSSGPVTSGPLPPPPATTAVSGAIRPGDVLAISFAGETDLAQQTRVDWNGMINLPILAAGDSAEIRAEGLSPSALASRISALAKKNKVLVDARAQVLVTEFAGQSYAVLGQVAQPGRYTFQRGLPPRLPIEEAIALAGGYTRLARQSRVLVKRGGNVYVVDFEKLASRPGQPPAIIIPGDIITINERRF
jgi:protein involved in polysaccharide export with SLBB domain